MRGTQSKWGGKSYWYLSITALLSQIYRSVQAAQGGRRVPNITNHGIRPANNLLMCLSRAAERSNAGCLFGDWHVFKGAFGWGVGLSLFGGAFRT